jgi:RNA polymerase sigma-70 factor (ECF subfamily)
MNERELLAAARDGSEDAFARLISPYRAGLSAHCYRLLGSVHDAEDALQEAMLRAWRGLAGFRGRSSLRSWLYTITTNACLRVIERRPKRVLPIDYGPATADPHAQPGAPILESVWIEPYPDQGLAFADELASPEARYEQRESVELAFVAALQHLPARQRAVLILRDVLGFSGAEVAAALAMTPDAVYSALQRAHKTVDERLPERTQQATLRLLGDDGLSEVVAGFVDAWERADVEALAARLAEDAAFTMPPNATWFRGRDRIAAFLRDFPLSGKLRWRVIPTRANCQPAFGLYAWSDKARAYVASELAVLMLETDRIAEITVFRDPPPLTRFGLPERIEP